MDAQRTPIVRRPEEHERRGSGLWIAFLRKLGLGPAYPPIGGPIAARGAGSSLVYVARRGLIETLIGSDAGLAAIVIAGTSLVAMVGILGHQLFSRPHPRALEASAGPWALFPIRERRALRANAPASPGGASNSLDHMRTAIERDRWLRELGARSAGTTVDAVANAKLAPPAPTAQTRKTPASDEFGGGSPSKPLLATASGFTGQNSGISMGGAAGLRDAPNARDPGPGEQVFGLTGLSRSRAGVGGGRRNLVQNRGRRTSDMARFANRDGLAQRGARNPSMSAAGYTFDGAGVNRIQGSAAGTPMPESFGGIPGKDGRFSPDKVIDQKEVPGPAPAKGEKDETPYKDQMMVAIGALLVAMILQKMGAQAKQQKQYKMAMMLHLLAAAAAGLAAAMGAQVMQDYDQRMQGMMFIVSGGMLALFNLKAAFDASKGKAEADKAADKATDNVNTTADKINAQFHPDGGSGSTLQSTEGAAPEPPSPGEEAPY